MPPPKGFKMPRKLAERTIRRELARRGWKESNCGDGWAAFTVPHGGYGYDGDDHGSPYAICLMVTWKHYGQHLKARNLTLPHIHFESYGIRFDSMGCFDHLMGEVARLRKLVALDIDRLDPDGEQEQYRQTAALMAEHDNQRIEAEWHGGEY